MPGSALFANGGAPAFGGGAFSTAWSFIPLTSQSGAVFF
jgi:hypothetical protein